MKVNKNNDECINNGVRMNDVIMMYNEYIKNTNKKGCMKLYLLMRYINSVWF